VDSTLPLQNELSLILKAMVAALSELKMLEQNRMLLQQSNQELVLAGRCTLYSAISASITVTASLAR